MAVHVCSISDLKNFDGAEKFAIVRSLKAPITGVSQLPVLSPSKQLFWHYLYLKKRDFWNKTTFDQDYRLRFLEEMCQPEPQAILQQIAAASHEHDIVLACFCKDVDMCHRSLVYDILRHLGANLGIRQ